MKTKAALLACSVLTTALVALPVYAQTTPVPPSSQDAPVTDDDPLGEGQEPGSSVDDVVVVGTRIVRDGYEAPTPQAVFGEERIQSSASSNLAQAIVSLPVFSGSSTSRTGVASGSTGTAGANSLNLRSLGSNRTLVLLNGHRVPPVSASGIVDINMVPQALVSRVTVVTGGASAVYGSDAVAGVVDFGLDRSFSGLRGEVSGGQTNYGDGENYKISLAGGLDFAGGRGRLLLAGEQVDDDGIGPNEDREWSRRGVQLLVNPNYTATNGQPQRLVASSVGYFTAHPGGIIVGGPLAATAFGPGGTPFPLDLGSIRNDPYMQGGDWRMTDIRQVAAISPAESRQTAFGRVSYDLTDSVNVYAQAAYVSVDTTANLTYVYLPGSAGPLIDIANPFIPAAVRARMVETGITSFRLGTLNGDLGIPTNNSERDSTVFTLGADGDFNLFGKSWAWDVYAQTAETNTRLEIDGNISRPNYALAVDAVTSGGSVVCRSTLTNPNNGCSPWNPMGIGVNQNNAAGAAFIHANSWQEGRIRQDVYAGTVSGEPFSNWAGPISLALSLEHREDTAQATVDALSLTQSHVYGNYTPIDGSTSVTEGALETVIPLLNDQLSIFSWDLNAAVRYASYSEAGEVTSWKVGTTFSPIEDVKIRITRSRDIRAPNIQELFSPAATLRSSIFDPFTNTTPAFSQSTVGNRNLVPEQGDTTGVGVVYQPGFIPGLSASVDYWDINIEDAISSVSPANVLLLCFDGTRPDLCANITRAPDGTLTEVVSQVINFATQHVRGIDFEASYRVSLDTFSEGLRGDLAIYGNLTRYLENYIDSRVAPPQDYVGENSLYNPPNWRFSGTVSYSLDPLNLSLTARGFSDGVQFANYIECRTTCPTSTSAHPTVDNNHMDGKIYLDLSASYEFDIGGRELTAFFNARNLGDVDPVPAVQAVNWQNGTNAVLYDVEGRVYRAGLRFKF